VKPTGTNDDVDILLLFYAICMLSHLLWSSYIVLIIVHRCTESCRQLPSLPQYLSLLKSTLPICCLDLFSVSLAATRHSDSCRQEIVLAQCMRLHDTLARSKNVRRARTFWPTIFTSSDRATPRHTRYTPTQPHTLRANVRFFRNRESDRQSNLAPM